MHERQSTEEGRESVPLVFVLISTDRKVNSFSFIHTSCIIVALDNATLFFLNKKDLEEETQSVKTNGAR